MVYAFTLIIWSVLGLICVALYELFILKDELREPPPRWHKWTLTPLKVLVAGPVLWVLLVRRWRTLRKIIKDEFSDME